jgi:hypothetical protein
MIAVAGFVAGMLCALLAVVRLYLVDDPDVALAGPRMA